MNDFFRFVGVIVLLFGTFVYTEKVQVASKVTDEILLKIDEVKSNYEVKAIEPIIKGNTIIPGKNGKEIDVSATYNVLAQSSSFNEKLFVYKPKYVKTKLEKNKNKFIVGACKNNKSIGLLFKVSDNDSISKVKQVLDKANVKATFYVTSGFFEKNYELVIRLISEGHTICNLINNEDYNDGNFAWMSTILTSSGSQKNNYCYASYLNKDVLKI
ncbi:MAG: polysaccharide deacetylase family protein [Bacilli bacterium]|nr:polysaccharide deacetylase family protein [Bacilli bacterium]